MLGIVMVTQGCDNVEWGGVDVGLKAPSELTVMETHGRPADTTAAPEDVTSSWPILYLGRRAGPEAWLVPVAELHPDGLRELPPGASAQEARAFADRHFAPGSTFTLFAEGVRVGTLTAAVDGVDGTYCGARPQVRGPIELIPAAVSVTSFLALPSDRTATIEYEDYRPVQQTRDLRVTSLNMMSGLIPTLQATWPESVLGMRRDIQVFQSRTDEAPVVVATFVYGDSLRVGPAPADAYSVFLIASDPEGNGYRTTYVDYRLWSRHGKGAARYFGRLDVDGDGSSELILEVLGERETWLTALKRGNGGWTEVYRDPCGLPAPASVGAAAP